MGTVISWRSLGGHCQLLEVCAWTLLASLASVASLQSESQSDIDALCATAQAIRKIGSRPQNHSTANTCSRFVISHDIP